LLSLTPLLSTNANAEGYVAFQLGATIPNDLRDIRGTGAFSGVTISDLELKTDFLYGGKIGYYFSQPKWLGVETEVFTSKPDFAAQTVTVTGPGGSVAVALPELEGSRETVWAFNLLARYPGEQFQPYAGIGLGIFFIEDADTAPGLNVLAGGRFFLTKNFALFGEYKYTHASSETSLTVAGVGTGSFEFDFSAHRLAFGLGFHF
jgi:opacity protein-like surface antigen